MKYWVILNKDIIVKRVRGDLPKPEVDERFSVVTDDDLTGNEIEEKSEEISIEEKQLIDPLVFEKEKDEPNTFSEELSGQVALVSVFLLMELQKQSITKASKIKIRNVDGNISKISVGKYLNLMKSLALKNLCRDVKDSKD